jgi:hypothetical protein
MPSQGLPARSKLLMVVLEGRTAARMAKTPTLVAAAPWLGPVVRPVLGRASRFSCVRTGPAGGVSDECGSNLC